MSKFKENYLVKRKAYGEETLNSHRNNLGSGHKALNHLRYVLKENRSLQYDYLYCQDESGVTASKYDV